MTVLIYSQWRYTGTTESQRKLPESGEARRNVFQREVRRAEQEGKADTRNKKEIVRGEGVT